MKKSLLMTLFIFSLHTLAQQGQGKIDLYGREIITATEEDKFVAALNVGEVAMVQTSAIAKPKKDCDNSKEQPKTKPENEIICFCDLEKTENLKNQDKDKNAKNFPLIGSLLFVEQDFVSGNDNFLHGAPRLIPGFVKYDGSDYGRTFGLGTSVKFVGDKGEAFIGFDSTGFGKGVTVNGYNYTYDRKRNLEFLEKNTLSLRLDKFWNIQEDGKNRTFVEIAYVEKTDQGKIAMPVQDWWHKMNGEKRSVRYNYLNFLEKPSHEVMAQIGIGKDLLMDLSKWKCLIRAELKTGFSSKKNGLIGGAKISTQAKHRAIPWLAVSMYAERIAGSDGPEKHRGIVMSFPFRTNKIEVEPYLGIERHQTNMDKRSERPGVNPYEPYHTLGIKIRY